jgi:hypothetical protein
MTTGRINQVTIVCRGWPPAHISALERFKLLVAPRGRAVHSTVGRANSAADGSPLSPSKFPRASVRHTTPAMGRAAWAPQEEDSARGFYHFGVRHARLPPAAQW